MTGPDDVPGYHPNARLHLQTIGWGLLSLIGDSVWAQLTFLGLLAVSLLANAGEDAYWARHGR